MVPSWGTEGKWNLGAETELSCFSLWNWYADLSQQVCIHLFLVWLEKIMMEKMQRTRERATLVLPFPASLSPPLCSGKQFSAGEALCGEFQIWPGTVVLQGHLLFRKLEWALFPPCRVAPGTPALCLLSLPSPFLWPAVHALCLSFS